MYNILQHSAFTSLSISFPCDYAFYKNADHASYIVVNCACDLLVLVAHILNVVIYVSFWLIGSDTL